METKLLPVGGNLNGNELLEGPYCGPSKTIETEARFESDHYSLSSRRLSRASN